MENGRGFRRRTKKRRRRRRRNGQVLKSKRTRDKRRKSGSGRGQEQIDYILDTLRQVTKSLSPSYVLYLALHPFALHQERLATVL